MLGREKAREKLLGAEAITAGRGAYNLACLSALEGDADECRQWLDVCKRTGRLPSKENMLADPDLASVRGEPWFLDLLKAS